MRSFIQYRTNILIIAFYLIIGGVVAKTNLPFKDTLANQKIYVEVLDNKPQKNILDQILEYLKDYSGPLLTIIGFGVAYPILKRKLTESHITSTLNHIQETNRIVSKKCQELIDEYIPRTYENNPLNKTHLENVFEKIKEVYYISLDASGDSTTFLYLLKNTLQITLKHYDKEDNHAITSRDLYGLIIETLEEVRFYCTQVVQIPKSTKTLEKSIISYKIKNFVTNSNVLKYKHFNIGVIDDPKSVHYTQFYGIVNASSSALLKRSAFQTIYSIYPISLIMYSDEIYAPIILTWYSDQQPFIGDSGYHLYLVGINFSSQFVGGGTPAKEIVKLTYTNYSDFSRFVKGLEYNVLKEKYEDTFMQKDIVDIKKSIKMELTGTETFTLTYEKEYLSAIFKQNKKKIKRKIEGLKNLYR